METRYLKTLLEVLKSGSFSRAADILNITQSAVSQRIRFMEELYGMSLIDRTGSLITATKAGNTVLKNARQILALEKELDGELKGLKQRPSFPLDAPQHWGLSTYPKCSACSFWLIPKKHKSSHMLTPLEMC